MYINKKNEIIKLKRKKINFLNITLKKKAGRNSKGKIILFGRGGGYKRKYKIIDFTRILLNIPGIIIRFEYDSNRNVFVMLMSYINGYLVYKIAPMLIFLKINLFSCDNLLIKKGIILQIKQCLVGTMIYNLQMFYNQKSKYSRSAGTFIQVVRKVGSFVLLRFPSGEERILSNYNFCNIGRISCEMIKLLKKKSAGENRRKGYRPKVRGVAKNPIDHPHGGGEGKTTAAQPSVSPWGIYTKGIRTTTRFKRLIYFKIGLFKRRDKKIW